MRTRRLATLPVGLLLALMARGAAAAEAPAAAVVEQVPLTTAEPIQGRRVSDLDGKVVGRLVDVLVDEAGKPQAAVIDFGGFMGLGNRRIAVQWETLRFAPGDDKNPVTLQMTFDAIKAAPEYKDMRKTAPVVVPASPVAGAGAEATSH